MERRCQFQDQADKEIVAVPHRAHGGERWRGWAVARRGEDGKRSMAYMVETIGSAKRFIKLF